MVLYILADSSLHRPNSNHTHFRRLPQSLFGTEAVTASQELKGRVDSLDLTDSFGGDSIFQSSGGWLALVGWFCLFST